MKVVPGHSEVEVEDVPADPLSCVRDDRWRLIHYADGSEEIYDHERDPHEWTNLAADRRLDAVRARLSKAMPPGPDPQSK